DDHLPQLAHHFARARDVDKAIEYASRAGDRALDQLAHDEAAAYYRQALELLDPAARPDGEARRCELLIALGAAQRRPRDLARRYPTLVTNAERRAEMVELEHLAAGLDAALLVWARLWRSLADLTLGHLEGYHRGLESAMELADELRQPLLRWPVAFLDAGR